MPDLTPAPGSTATSAPSAVIFLMVSGVAATRGSPASTSAATATFMIPPTAASRVVGSMGLSRRLPGPPEAATPFGSDEEDGHENDDDDDGREHAFHQIDEIAVGLLMGLVIVARGSGV